MVTLVDKNERENVSRVELKILELSGNGWRGAEMDIKSAVPLHDRKSHQGRAEEERGILQRDEIPNHSSHESCSF